MKKNKTQTASDERITIKEQLSYGIATGGEGLGMGLVDSFSTYFLTNIASIAPGIASILLVVSKVIDFFTDAFMGSIVDRTKHKNGKAKPWLLWSIIPYSVGIILFFSAPFTNTTATIIWALLTYTLCTAVGFTMYCIPLQSIVALSSNDPKERNKMQFAYTFGRLLFILAASMCITPLSTAFGGGKQGWFWTAVVIGVVSAGLHLIGYFGIKERVSEEAAPRENPLKSIANAWKIAISNKYILIIFAISILGNINTMTTFVTYYCQYVLNDFTLVGMMLVVALLPNVIGIIVVRPLVPKFGKRTINVAGFIIQFAGGLCAILFSTNMTALIISLVVSNFGVAGMSSTALSMLADSIDYMEWKKGIRNTGSCFSAFNCIQKLTVALKSGLVGLILSLGAYIEGDVAVQPDSALTAIKFGFLWVPVICAVLSLIVTMFYDLDKKMPQIKADLSKRNADAVSE